MAVGHDQREGGESATGKLHISFSLVPVFCFVSPYVLACVGSTRPSTIMTCLFCV